MSYLPRTLPTLAAAVLLIAACSSPGKANPEPTPPPTAEPSTITTTSSPAPILRPGAVGQAFDVPGWTVTVTGVKYGPYQEVAPDAGGSGMTDPTAVVTVTAVNKGTAPTQFAYGYMAEQAAYGLDSGGRRFELGPYAKGPINPGVPSNEVLLFTVPAGLHLSSVVIGDVKVILP